MNDQDLDDLDLEELLGLASRARARLKRACEALQAGDTATAAKLLQIVLSKVETILGGELGLAEIRAAYAVERILERFQKG